MIVFKRLYTTSSKAGATRSLFENPKNKEFYQVYQNDMDEHSFIGPEKGLAKILKPPRSAYIHSKIIISNSKQYMNCEIEMIPWEEWIQYLTIAVVKSSPYEPFLREYLNGFHGNGIMRKLQQKWIHQETNCATYDFMPISHQKVIVAFIWIHWEW